MREIERWRETISELPGPEAIAKRKAEGWRLAAVEWERETARASSDGKRPIPYGLRIAADCLHLEVDPTEREVLSIIIAMIAADHALSRIAAALNEQGFRTRLGAEWTQLAIFRMLPRVIEFGPEILSEKEWSDSKKRLLEAVS